MSQRFDTDSQMGAPLHLVGCGCERHARRSRRLFGAGLLAAGAAAAWPAWADGVVVDDRSALTKLAPADQLEQAAAGQYRQMLQQAAQRDALAPPSNPQLVRLRSIAQRIIPYSSSPNLKSTPRAAQWKWEVNLLGSKQINAFCMPGGKIAVYYGLLSQLKATDDELAIVLGHEIAHALREHARERIGKQFATNAAIEIGSALFGLGNTGRYLANMGGQLLTLRFSRADESEADKVGLDLAARAGYDPRAGVSLWQKMGAVSKGAPPAWFSTHPPGPDRIREIESNLPAVEPLYASAEKPAQHFGPPAVRAEPGTPPR